MSVGILLMTHPGIGSSMLHSANRILGCCSLQTKCLEVPSDVALDRVEKNVLKMIGQLDQGDGVLILTDVYGATPNNLACKFAKQDSTVIIAGLNLSMLIRAFNYSDQSLKELSQIAMEGAQKGIQVCHFYSED